MSAAVFDHPFLAGLLGDAQVSAVFSARADLDAMLAFEADLAAAQAASGLISTDAATAIAAAIFDFSLDPADFSDAVARDGVIVPALVRRLRDIVGEPHAASVHKGATSQDVIDTSLALRLKAAAAILDRRLEELIAALDALDRSDGQRALTAHTRMQRARPITLAHKIAGWRAPLERHRARLVELAPRVFTVQLGGAVGNRAELGAEGAAIAADLADRLGLSPSARATHADRDGIAEFGHWCALIAGSLGKIGVDVALMAQNEVGEVRIAGGGGSSAMPEKCNPVGAEILVTLARFTATLQSGLDHALVHENERSGAAWTLEWMILPQMVVATGAATRTALDLIAAVRFHV